MNDPVLSALRRIRALENGGSGLALRMLEIVAEATASTSASLRHPVLSEEIRTAARGDDAAVLEHRFPGPSGVVVVSLARSSGCPFAAEEATTLEVLGGEIVVRFEGAYAEMEADRLRRQLELLRALSRAGEDAIRLPDLADRAARALKGAFGGADVLVHVVVEQQLELIARHVESGKSIDEAPEWARHMTLDGSTVMAVAAREKRVVSRAVHEIPAHRRAFLDASGVRHVLAIPLLSHDAVFGTLTVAHSHDEPWDAESLRLLESAATQVSVELAHVRVLEAERRRAEDLGLFNELGSLVSQHLDLRAVLVTAASALSRISQVSRVLVLLADPTAKVLSGIACTEGDISEVTLAFATSVAVAHAFRTLEPVVVDDAETDSRTNKELVAQIGTRSLMVVPLVSRGAAIGAVVLVEMRHKRKFTKTDVGRAVAVANLVSPAVANAKMFEDLRRSYEALARAQAELVTHERLAALGELSAVIAHEVRNPVAIIFNSLGALRRIGSRTADATALLDIVGEEATRLNRIVGDLLDFVRPYTAHPRQVQADAIVRGAVDAARRATGDSSVEIRTDVSLASNELFLDGTMLERALVNLIVNAIQATPEGKTVTIRAFSVSEGADAKLRCDVADEGPRIDADSSARMFQPFFTTKATGTGLGLAVVRRLADALGGAVEVSCGPTSGTLFTLTLPLVAATADS